MQYTPEEKVYIWLDSFPLADGDKRWLIENAGSPAALTRNFSALSRALADFKKDTPENALENAPDEPQDEKDQDGDAILAKMSDSLRDGGEYFRKLSARLEEKKIVAVTAVSAAYPPALKKLSDAPLVLYSIGNTELLKTPLFTVVGSRRTPMSAIKAGEKITSALAASGFTIVTGTACGGDQAAAEGALKSGRIVCVAAGGFSALPKDNLPFLKQVAARGLIITAHTYDKEVRSYSYESRNKLLAALGQGTLVLGAAEKSGALITAKYAAEFKKPLFALPYPPGAAAGAGCNALIKKGAHLTEDASDVAAVFGLTLKTPVSVPLTADEDKVLTALKELSEAHIMTLAEKSGIPMYKLSGILSALEVKGLAVRLGGNRFAPVV